ncbi:MAG TPA: hypothetical protein VF787_08775 [Thermoanaerobaculia bacterium]
MSRRLIVPIVIFATLMTVSAEAQKRRAVRAPSAPPPSGQCHTFGLVRTGLIASYSTVPASTFTVTYISDTPTRTVTKQRVMAAGTTTDVDTILDGEVVGNLRGLKHINVKATTSVPILGSLTIETDVDFVPSLIAGPSAGWCVGNTWSIPATTETVTVKSPIAPPTNTIKVTVAGTGEVLAVGETVVVPAGSFQTVKYRGVMVQDGNVQTAITWVSMEHNIVVKQDALDANGAVTTALVLTALQ